jgi:type I restriction enzyme M protein
MMTAVVQNQTTGLGDYYWAYADILRGIGINETMYDQRILAFMALKLLIDNQKIAFNFDYRNNFGLPEDLYANYRREDTKSTFLNLIEHITDFGQNLRYFEQESRYNPDTHTNLLAYLNHKKVFRLGEYIEELPNNYLEMVLDIYTQKADFTNYPKEQYKDLYETTIARMKKLSGDLTGQHFTQKAIIHLMCESVLKDLEDNRHIAIYDPACGTGSMLMESAIYFYDKLESPHIDIYGQEYHAQTWLLAKIFLEITSLDGEKQGIPNIIACGNTLTDPAFSEGINGSDSFDFIIANPPFGVDWKHDYEAIAANMKQEGTLGGDESHFYVVRDEKGKIVLPKKSDGQFLFMLHIIKLMLREKARGKRAKAAVISSSTLISTGSERGSEAKIRKAIFGQQILKAVVEQPNAMFTNTDVSSHIWFFDTAHESGKCTVIKVDNDDKPLFIPHPEPKDKMKNSYSPENIRQIINLMHRGQRYRSKKIDTTNLTVINIGSVIERKQVETEVDLQELMSQIKMEMKNLCHTEDIW